MRFVFWRWYDGTISRVHKVHPTAPGFTWCGARCTPSVGNSVAVAYEHKRDTTRPQERDGCLDCLTMARPCILNTGKYSRMKAPAVLELVK